MARLDGRVERVDVAVDREGDEPAVADVLDGHPSGDLLVESGHRQQAYAPLVAAKHLAHDFRRHVVDDRDHEVGGALLVGQAHEVGRAAEDRQAVHALADLGDVVVHETEDVMARLALHQRLGDAAAAWPAPTMIVRRQNVERRNTSANARRHVTREPAVSASCWSSIVLVAGSGGERSGMSR